MHACPPNVVSTAFAPETPSPVLVMHIAIRDASYCIQCRVQWLWYTKGWVAMWQTPQMDLEFNYEIHSNYMPWGGNG